jgi:UDP-N-acetyl-2-amino-2-deoxyglucuronate dehydrogenase
VRYALTGAAGFVAPRHLRAIADTGGELAAALDPHDAVGVLDRFNRDARFFTEPERFDRFLWKQRGQINFVSVCAPNHLHDAHCRMALRSGADAICEKPLALRPWNVEELVELERQTGQRIFVVLQLRLHPAFAGLRESLAGRSNLRVQIRYVTPRGRWYDSSWKGDPMRSGGVCMNVGIHLFDLLGWLFGDPVEVTLESLSHRRGSGRLRFERADVEWLLSTSAEDLPEGRTEALRVFEVDGQRIDASSGFEGLHTRLYELAHQGTAPRAEDARRGVEIVHAINRKGGIW